MVLCIVMLVFGVYLLGVVPPLVLAVGVVGDVDGVFGYGI